MSVTDRPRSTTPRAPMPGPPARQYSFTDWQTNNPTAPPPGDRMDAEYDRANTAISDTITWASTSLNTDGTIRDGVIGSNQLVSGLFDDVAQGIIDEVQPLVDQAQSYADAAAAASSTAQAAATAADTSNTAAQGAATTANSAATAAQSARTDAQTYAGTAQTAAADAANADNHATGEAGWASNYAVLAEAWAEHMPDPIPPNILAVMGITGDHWSSRWWATKAENAFGSLTSLYLGVWPTPPLTTALGEPIPVGAIYYNSTSQQAFVWTGTEWAPLYKPAKSYLLTLLYRATANQTVFPLTALDLGSNSYTLSPIDPEPLEVNVNGVRLPQDEPNPGNGDWTLDIATSTVNFLTPLLAGTLVQIDVMASVSQLAPSRVQTQALLDFDIDPVTGNPGQIDGTKTTFPLTLAAPPHDAVPVGAAQELFVSLDGVVQQPGTDYSVSGSNITFTDAPIVGARSWGYWYGPGLTSSGPSTGYLPITGGVLTGPLTLAGPPTLSLQAATKAYVDGMSGGGPFLPLSGGTVTGSVTIGGAQPNALALSGGNGQATIAGTGTNGGINLWPTGNGQVNLGMNHAYTGTANTGVYTNFTAHGTITDNSTPYNILTVVTEGVSAAGAQGGGMSNIRNAINLQAGGVGGRTAFGIDFHQTGTTNINGVGQYYVALSAYATAAYSAGGTAGTPMGILFGAVDSARLDTGATFWDGVCGYELDIGAATGTSVAYKQGMKVVLWNTDAVAGTQGADFCYSMNAMSGFVGPGWDVGYCFGSPDGVWPIKTTGTLIGTVPTAMGGRVYGATHGVDFSAITFSQDAFKSNGFRVDGYGDVSAAGVYVGPASIDANGIGTLHGLKFGSQLAASPTDLSKHIALYGTDRGINVDNSANLGIVSSSAITFNISGSAVGYIDSTGLNNMEIGNTYQHPGTFTQVKVGGTTGPTWTTGSAAPAATAPVGSLYSRTGGAVGATLYVSRGAGTWAAVAGV